MDELCCRCASPANHIDGRNHFCCACWVDAGNSPADWHGGCRRRAKELRENAFQGVFPEGWIDVRDCLPEKDQVVIAWSNDYDRRAVTARFDGESWWVGNVGLYLVAGWTPLPPLKRGPTPGKQ